MNNTLLKQELLLFKSLTKGKYMGENICKTCLANNLCFDYIMKPYAQQDNDKITNLKKCTAKHGTTFIIPVFWESKTILGYIGR